MTRNINDLPEWKGDPNDKTAIEAWKKSYGAGYTPRIISPRDSDGKYTSDPKKTVGYISMDKVTHAKEIAIALQSESNIPISIIDSLQKTLAGVKDSRTTNAPTATTLTKTKKEESTTRNLTDMNSGKVIGVIIALFVIIFGVLKLGQTR